MQKDKKRRTSSSCAPAHALAPANSCLVSRDAFCIRALPPSLLTRDSSRPRQILGTCRLIEHQAVPQAYTALGASPDRPARARASARALARSPGGSHLLFSTTQKSISGARALLALINPLRPAMAAPGPCRSRSCQAR